MSFITRNLRVLRERHYVRKADVSTKYWFDLSHGPLQRYRNRGEHFCVVLYGSETRDDAYVIPFARLKRLLTDDALDGRNRWMGHIADDQLQLRRSRRGLDVSPFYNAYKLLDRP